MKNFLSAKTTASWLALLFKLMILVLGVLLPFRLAEAVPSFARQTGATCSQCHVQGFGPNLTPMGRQFKLEGYTLSLPGQSFAYPPLSAMVQGSLPIRTRGSPVGRRRTLVRMTISPSTKRASSGEAALSRGLNPSAPSCS